MIRTLSVHEANPDRRKIQQAADVLAKGGLVIAPTETGYCFFGDAALESTHTHFLALRKAHPRHKPFSVLCRDITQVSEIGLLTTSIFRVARRVLPGPYTLVLETTHSTPLYVAGPRRKTVGIRVSSHPVAAELVRAFGRPLLLTSITDAEELLQEYFEDEDVSDAWWTSVPEIAQKFKRDVDIALENDQPVPMRVSTVVDFSHSPPVVLRDGGWSTDLLGIIS